MLEPSFITGCLHVCVFVRLSDFAFVSHSVSLSLSLSSNVMVCFWPSFLVSMFVRCICVFVCMCSPSCLSVVLLTCLFTQVYLSANQHSMSTFVNCQFFFRLYVCLFGCLPVRLSVYLPACPCVCLSVCLRVCLCQSIRVALRRRYL